MHVTFRYRQAAILLVVDSRVPCAENTSNSFSCLGFVYQCLCLQSNRSDWQALCTPTCIFIWGHGEGGIWYSNIVALIEIRKRNVLADSCVRRNSYIWIFLCMQHFLELAIRHLSSHCSWPWEEPFPYGHLATVPHIIKLTLTRLWNPLIRD